MARWKPVEFLLIALHAEHLKKVSVNVLRKLLIVPVSSLRGQVSMHINLMVVQYVELLFIGTLSTTHSKIKWRHICVKYYSYLRL